MTNDQQLKICSEAVSTLPRKIQNDYLGVAFLKLQTMLDLPREAQLQALRYHVEYEVKKEKSPQPNMVFLSFDPSQNDDELAEIEIRDTLRSLQPQDRAIVSMILAGHSHRDIAEDQGISLSTLKRQLKKLRGVFHAY